MDVDSYYFEQKMWSRRSTSIVFVRARREYPFQNKLIGQVNTGMCSAQSIKTEIVKNVKLDRGMKRLNSWSTGWQGVPNQHRHNGNRPNFCSSQSNTEKISNYHVKK